MSSHKKPVTIYAAIASNMLIAAAMFTAGMVTSRSAMPS